MKPYILLVALTLILGACVSTVKTKTEPITDKWIHLLDGSSLDGWRAYNGDALPPGWDIQDKTLTFTPQVLTENDQSYDGSRDIIYAAEEFENFELHVEWKIPAGGNSGIFYHVKEGYDGPHVVAPEYQLIDDENYENLHDLTAYNLSLGYNDKPEELKPLQQTASDYAMYPADANKTLHPTGEWNSTKIVFTEEVVEYWLNGSKVLSFVPWSEDWIERKNSDKWSNSPDYGKFKKGYIAFQDHGSDLSFRNVKIKKL